MNNKELFLLEKGVTYDNIENLFTYEKYYRAMKKLSSKEKKVLFLTVVKEKSIGQVADIMGIAEEKVMLIKRIAIRNFLDNLSEEK